MGDFLVNQLEHVRDDTQSRKRSSSAVVGVRACGAIFSNALRRLGKIPPILSVLSFALSRLGGIMTWEFC